MSEERWFESLPSFDVGIRCEGRVHQLRWTAGELTASDHDVASETAFAAFGGDEAPCLAAVANWQDQHTPNSIAMWRLEGWGPEGPVLKPAGDQQVEEDGTLPDRLRALGALAALAKLVGSWRSWEGLDDMDQTAQRIARFQRERFHTAADASLEPTRQGRRRVRVTLHHGLVLANEQPEVTADVAPGTIRLKAGLPLSWLVEVWGRGAAVVDDHLVLAVRDVGEGQLVATALRWETVSRSLVTPTLRTIGLSATANGWRIEDEPPDGDPPKIWFSATSSRVPRR